ncbi:ATP-dependent helicase/nuclease subunit A [Clostridium punense]|uniref:ATP-dependent helicase/nuclease subunit A n=2 Tax=Clostridium TaxID=1485 RepID=A0ABS4K2K0_9CLOT|nr:UvrD-helicase domain-containing protein [Clostridium punense]MBP2022008.1 ATP-dependent helicase/nuclease subunit A [Clostridium punense]
MENREDDNTGLDRASLTGDETSKEASHSEKKASEVKWTEDQLKAINTRHADILVSAAAGSGKTAVLVERIIKIITNKDNPVDIDRMLIVTFTNAAAAEMRERIGEAISKELEKNPNNSNLQKQLTLLNKANISTLHSFCLNLIRNNFHQIDLDPSFRVGDSTEIALLRGESLDEVFEEKYNEENESFHKLVESYCNNKSDRALYDLIQRLYNFSMSTPNPKKWLLEKAEDFNVTEGFKEFSFKEEFVKEVIEELTLGEKFLKRGLRLIDENDFLEKYRENLQSDLDITQGAKGMVETSFEELNSFIKDTSFGKLVTVRLKDEEEKILQEEVKTLRNKAKDIYKGVSEKILSFTSPENAERLKELYPLMMELSTLVIEFREKFSKKKRERGIIDFNDQEHFALEILKTIDEEGREVPSQVALDLRNKFEEILVDEYQDSNDVQEEIVNLISRKESGFRNRFMVGDLKQSIYRFRMAKPELFKEKKDSYAREEGGDNRLITLHKNFRSREEVINGINYIFNSTMSEKVGELHYTEEEELKLGAEFQPLDEEGVAGGAVELHIISLDNEVELSKEEITLREDEVSCDGEFKGEQKILEKISLIETTSSSKEQENLEEEMEGELEEEELDAIQIEARVVAKRIQELMEYRGKDTFKVYDKNLKGYRQVQFKDIVILLRSANKFAPIYVEEFKNLNLPLYAEGGTGYFDTIEVKTIISLLQIIDNPLQDIPLVAVLRSPIGGFTSGELADIRLIDKKLNFYDAMRKYVREHSLIKDVNLQEELGLDVIEDYNLQFSRNASEDSNVSNESENMSFAKEDNYLDILNENNETEDSEEPLTRKIKEFLRILQMWRNRARYTPINNLIWELCMETGYYGYVGAMPAGIQRQANLRILFQRAKEFERTSYKGLYNFINFINNLQKNSEDLGAAKIIGENEDVVRVMSIHKSKGLEFPVVFLCGMSKQFNQSDLKSRILFHNELGYGPMYVDLEKRVTLSTAQRDYISKKIEGENKSEEMRLLYVALTRAKEKLILVSSHKKLHKKIEDWAEAARDEEDIISENYTSRQKNYMDWVAPAIMKHIDGESLRKFEDDINIEDINHHKSKWIVVFHNKADFTKVVEEEETTISIEEKLKELEEAPINEEYREIIERNLNYKYKYEEATKLPTVITVSKLKSMDIVENFTEDEERLQDDYHREYNKPLMKAPLFLQEKKGLTPAEVGTALHGVMQRLDLEKVNTLEEIKEQIKQMQFREILTPEETKVIKGEKIYNFFQSGLGVRMLQAYKNGTLKRELPFRMEVSSTLLDNSLSGEIYNEEKIVLRGIIDCYFEEEGKAIILDYKTDYVPKGEEQVVVDRYRTQLNYYGEAIEKLIGKEVKEKCLYLFSIDKEVNIDKI